MRKLALVIKSVVISLCCMNCAWADDIDAGDYSLRFLAINIGSRIQKAHKKSRICCSVRPK